ncbi:hypothetical protein [Streptacidiphilus sp. MAP12-16]|uniref:hypothetical protein n=1 Tax=Streptacidiphilus sp. MAP12-16 TaxID=3156300 RepID=UPI003513199C
MEQGADDGDAKGRGQHSIVTGFIPRDTPHWKLKVLPAIAEIMLPDSQTGIRGMAGAVTDSDLERKEP